MISEVEKKQYHDSKEWEQQNTYWIIGSIVVAIFAFLRLMWRWNLTYWELKEIFDNAIPTTIIQLMMIIFSLFLISKAKERIIKIENIAYNFQSADNLGRKTIIAAKNILYISVTFHVITFLLFVADYLKVKL